MAESIAAPQSRTATGHASTLNAVIIMSMLSRAVGLLLLRSIHSILSRVRWIGAFGNLGLPAQMLKADKVNFSIDPRPTGFLHASLLQLRF